jgi:hypothetical protein
MTSVWLSPELKAIRAGRPPSALSGGNLDSLWVEAPVADFRLKRSGMVPLGFQGMLLLAHISESADHDQRRHTVRLYETSKATFVVEIILASADEACIPHCVAEEVESLADAERVLNDYDPSGQAALRLTVDRDMDALSVAEMADALRRDAHHLASDFDTARQAVFFAAGRQSHSLLKGIN